MSGSTTVAGYRLSAPQPAIDASSVAASVLSYAILLAGLLTMAITLHMVVSNYSRLPFLDGWTEMEMAAKGGNALSPGWLWQQHNEHRLVIPKLFLAADLRLFRARQIFLLASIFAVQLLHWALLGWSLWVLGGWRGALWRTGAGLAGFCLFCPAQWQNFTWAFQVCFVLPQLLATASFVTLLLYWMKSQQRADTRAYRAWLVLSVLAALGATYSLASGNLLWPLLVLAALYLGLRRAAVGFAVTGTVSTILYLHNYVRPQNHADPLASLREPLALLKYCAMYFLSSWSHRDMAIWETVLLVALAIGVAISVRVVRYVRSFRPLAIQLCLTMLFCAGSAFVTATGRLNYGLQQAHVSRYQTIALLFWCCLGLLWLGGIYASRMRNGLVVAQVVVLLVFARGAAIVKYPMEEARERTFAQRVATAALITGVHDPVTLSKTSFQMDTPVKAVPFMRANGLSIFSDATSFEIGESLDTFFLPAQPDECLGFLEGGMPVDEPSGRGLRLAGWAWDATHHRPAAAIVVTTDGIITGLGAVGERLPPARFSNSKISSPNIGFYAFVPQPHPGAAVNLYAVLHSNPPSACYFDGWRQIGPSPGVHRLEVPVGSMSAP